MITSLQRFSLTLSGHLHAAYRAAAVLALAILGFAAPPTAHGRSSERALHFTPLHHRTAAPLLAPGACTASVRTGMLSEHLTVDNKRRTYLLYVPHRTPTTHRYGLLLTFHGLGESAQSYASYGFEKPSAEQLHFIVGYPDWLMAWNDAPSHNPDVDFTRQLIAATRAHYCIDPQRIYVSGISAGGPLAHRVGCNMAGQIAAIALYSGIYSFMDANVCRPAHAISVIAFHGTTDFTVPYSGTSPPYTSITAWTRAWAGRDGCTRGPTRFYHKGQTTASRYTGCRQGTEVALYTVAGGGHLDYCADGSCVAVVSRFFAAHPRR